MNKIKQEVILEKEDRLRYQVDKYKRKHRLLYQDVAGEIGLSNFELSRFMNGTIPVHDKKVNICVFFGKDQSYFW